MASGFFLIGSIHITGPSRSLDARKCLSSLQCCLVESVGKAASSAQEFPTAKYSYTPTCFPASFCLPISVRSALLSIMILESHTQTTLMPLFVILRQESSIATSDAKVASRAKSPRQVSLQCASALLGCQAGLLSGTTYVTSSMKYVSAAKLPLVRQDLPAISTLLPQTPSSTFHSKSCSPIIHIAKKVPRVPKMGISHCTRGFFEYRFIRSFKLPALVTPKITL